MYFRRCVMLGNLNNLSVLSFKKNLIKEQEKEITKHEQAHKSKAGNLAGPIVIDKDSNGIPTGGHVDIKMPVLNEKDPSKTIEHAKKVIDAALAPSDPSNQDYKVAATAGDILSKAKNLETKNKLNYLA